MTGRSQPPADPGRPRRSSRHQVALPHAPIVETGRRRFEATEFAEPRTGWRGRARMAREVLLGPTLANRRLRHERLSKVKALAVFSSDAISSVGWGANKSPFFFVFFPPRPPFLFPPPPPEILFVLVLAGAGALQWSLPIAAAIVLLLAIVVSSYRQTVRAYPNGGGSYIVAHSNLGVLPGLLAAASLLTDYVLTVSVSIAAGVDALASLESAFRPWAVPLSLVLVAVVAMINLRGVRESGTVFAIPTYVFVVTLAAAIGIAVAKVLVHGANPFAIASSPKAVPAATESLTVLLVLKAFASGCAAMTGTEAISNGVQAFKEPAARNARITLLWMGLILGSLFIGATVVARHYGFIPNQDDTILAQIGRTAFGGNSPLFALLNIMTAAILVLAANTSFADFPRLSAILARDGYMPRAFYARGSRLVFSAGIIVLALLSCLLLVVFDATTTRLIPLYAVGVFTAFTLSQAGMVRHWRASRSPGWQWPALINGIGAVSTGVVLLIIIEAKFLEGAWAILVLVPVLILMFAGIGRFYHALAQRLAVPETALPDLYPHGPGREPMVVPVESLDRATLQAIRQACETSSDVTAIHVTLDPDESSELSEQWAGRMPGVPLVVIDSPFRSLAEPIAAWLSNRLREPPHRLTLVIPRIEITHWWERPLVNQSLGRLRGLLRDHPRISIVESRFVPR